MAVADPEARARLLELKKDFRTWSELASYLGLSKGLVSLGKNGKRRSPSLRRALDLPARTKITLENVHDFDPDPEAIAHWLRGAKKVECEAVDCTRAVYKTGNNMFCQIHTWSTKEGRAYQRRLRRNGGGDV